MPLVTYNLKFDSFSINVYSLNFLQEYVYSSYHEISQIIISYVLLLFLYAWIITNMLSK